MSKSGNKGLGKGFGSLLPQDFDQSMLLDKNDRIQKIPLENINRDPNQPRKSFDEQAIGELAESIKRHGVLQPIVVTEKDSGEYYIVAGERRYRAAGVAGLTTIPALVRSLEELELLEISLVENIQRVNLNPLEQAVSFARLHEQFNVSYPDIAKRLGKAHTTIVNTVRLLQLPEFARKSLSKGKISEGHARAVLALKSEKLQKELIKNIEHNNWSVRRAELFVNQNKEVKHSKNPLSKKKDESIDYKTGEKLSTKWGFQITVSRKNKAGQITMKFDKSEQLEEFIKLLQDS